MCERNRRGWCVATGVAWSLWAAACAEPDDWELTEIAADEQAELLVEADEEEVEAPERTREDDEQAEEDEAPERTPAESVLTDSVTPTRALTLVGSIAAHVQANGSLDGGWCTGGTLSSVKLSPGRYQVICAGHGPANANAQVVASGVGTTGKHCKLEGAPGGATVTVWTVRCHDATGTVVDSAFKLIADHRSGTGDSGAYLTSSATGTVTRSWNSAGMSNTVANPSAGVYAVTLNGLSGSNKAVHVTAIDNSANRCKVGNWGGSIVAVRCFDTAGTLTNTPFSLTFQTVSLLDEAGVGSTIGAHSWISSGVVQPSWTQVLDACPGTPVPSLTATPTGAGGLDLELSLPEAEFAGGSEDNALPMVSGYGIGSSHCAIVSWEVDPAGTAETVIRCFDSAGAQVDASTTPFTFSISNKETPGSC